MLRVILMSKSKVYSETDQEKFNRRIGTSAKISSKILIAGFTALGMKRFTAHKIGESVVDAMSEGNKLPLGSVTDEAYYTIKHIAENGLAEGRAAEEVARMQESLARIHDSIGPTKEIAEWMMSSPELYQTVAITSTVITSAVIYAALSLVSSNTHDDYVKMKEQGTYREMQYRKVKDLLKPIVKPESHEFQKAERNAVPAAKLALRHNVEIFKRNFKDKLTVLAHRWKKELPVYGNSDEINTDGLLYILNEINKSNHTVARQIRSDPNFSADEALQKVLLDPNLSDYLADKVGDFHDFSESVKVSLGDTVHQLFPGMSNKDIGYRQFLKEWHGLRGDVLKKSFQRMDLHMIQNTSVKLVVELGNAINSGRPSDLKEAQARLLIWKGQLDRMEGYAQREGNESVKKTWKKSVTLINQYANNIDKGTGQAGRDISKLMLFLKSKGKLPSTNNASLILMDKLYGKDRVPIFKSFEGLYANTLLKTIETKVSEYLLVNELKPSSLKDMKQNDMASFKTLCEKHGLQEGQDILTMAEDAARVKMAKVLSKVAQKFACSEHTNSRHQEISMDL